MLIYYESWAVESDNRNFGIRAYHHKICSLNGTLGGPCLKNYIAFLAFLQEAIRQICEVGYCYSLPRLEEYTSHKHHFIHFPKIKHVVPNSDEREPKKKAKSSSKFRHQGCKWVDKLLCPDYRLCWGGPQREREKVRLEQRGFFEAKLVHIVSARLLTAGHFADVL